jgi:hypothetical protein
MSSDEAARRVPSAAATAPRPPASCIATLASHALVMALEDVYFFLIFPSSLSTRSFSASWVLQLRMSCM